MAALEAELQSWMIDDPQKQLEKVTRERIRHYKIIKDLCLDKLPTHTMRVLEVGCGPVPISDLLDCKYRLCLDPLTIPYEKKFPLVDVIPLRIEDFDPEVYGTFDLVISTNSLDHVDDPPEALGKMIEALKPGGYLAILCCDFNALRNPHPAHRHNLDPSFVHLWCDWQFETVWEVNWEKDRYRYGWKQFEGKVGQPAFCILMRKTIGYS